MKTNDLRFETADEAREYALINGFAIVEFDKHGRSGWLYKTDLVRQYHDWACANDDAGITPFGAVFFEIY